MNTDWILKYIDGLMAQSSATHPVWNKEVMLSGKENRWNYIDGCMIASVLELYKITKEPKYLEFADRFIGDFVQEDGTLRAYEVEEYNLDNVNPGKNLIALFELTGKEKYRKAADQIYRQVKTSPRTKSGNFWHKKIYPNQVWLDGLYMAQPFYMAYEMKFNRMENYLDIFRQFMHVRKVMRDERTGLYYHGWDESREMFWSDPVTGLSQNFWLRAMGWMVAGIIDTMDALGVRLYNEYRELGDMLKEAIDALLQFQDESGMFYQLIAKKDLPGNYLETSGTALIAYAILKAVRLEVLPERYKAYAVKAFNGILQRYAREENGELALGGICLVAGLGGQDRRDGSEAYYLSEPVVENEAKGIAPFLMAYVELLHDSE